MKYKVIKEMLFIKDSASSTDSLKYDVLEVDALVTSVPKGSIPSYKISWFFKMCSRDPHNTRRILFDFNGQLRSAVIGKDVVAVME